MRPVRAAGSRRGVPQDLGQALTAPAQDHGPLGTCGVSDPLALSRNRHAREPLTRFWAMIDERLRRISGTARPATRTQAANALPAAPVQAPHRSRDPLCPQSPHPCARNPNPTQSRSAHFSSIVTLNSFQGPSHRAHGAPRQAPRCSAALCLHAPEQAEKWTLNQVQGDDD